MRRALWRSSRRVTPGAPGFFAGQHYTDAVADGLRDRVGERNVDLAQMLSLVEATDSSEALRAAVLALAEGTSDDAAELVELAFLLAELAGRTAVLEDL